VVTITRKIEFCAGHRVVGHEGKCRNVHGHNYILYVTVSCDYLDDVGRVIDFSEVKDKVKGWIDANWDHGMILLYSDDELATHLQKSGHKVYLMDSNPTAENMCYHLMQDILPPLFEGSPVEVTKVTLWETSNCFATVRK